MRIVNLFELFQNPYNEPGWQLWNGGNLVGVFQTRAEARARARELREEGATR